ncbi:MAG: 50S ribosomal protein L32 [Candidatus Margulisiibacteriota bacterium]|nr:50S ribosomal protein L32 [Candidatus Margulisiibacteriota bacterium]
MPQPKKRHSPHRKGKRRGSNYKLTAKNIASCPQCGAPLMSHQACKACGTYKGRQVLKIKEKKAKKKEQ